MESIQAAASYILSVQGIALIVLGTVLGITMGAIPGLTGAMLIALTLPLTFSMDPIFAFISVSYTHLTLPTIYSV